MNFSFFPYRKIIKENRNWIILAVVIFFLSFIVFFAGLGIGNRQASDISEEMLSTLEIMADFILNSEPFYGALFIFINNIISSLQMLFLGAVFGLSPLFTLIINGAVLGTFSINLVQQEVSYVFLLVGILPHGIPELAAFFICAAMGLKIGIHATISPLPGKTRMESIKYIWKEIISLIPLVVILLFLAAFIEIYLTQRLLESFFI